MPPSSEDNESFDFIPFTLNSREIAGYIATLSPERQEALEVEMAQRRATIRLQSKRQAAKNTLGQESAIAPAAEEAGTETNLPRNPLARPTISASGSRESGAGEMITRAKPASLSVPDDTEDWIRSISGLYFNAKEMEVNAMTVCGNLISKCLVVGKGYPSPVMFIEPGVEMDQGKLKKEILRKTRPFYSRRYLHEQIVSPDMIIIVPEIPRTSGRANTRRDIVEEEYKSLLDRIFGQSK